MTSSVEDFFSNHVGMAGTEGKQKAIRGKSLGDPFSSCDDNSTLTFGDAIELVSSRANKSVVGGHQRLVFPYFFGRVYTLDQ